MYQSLSTGHGKPSTWLPLQELQHFCQFLLQERGILHELQHFRVFLLQLLQRLNLGLLEVALKEVVEVCKKGVGIAGDCAPTKPTPRHFGLNETGRRPLDRRPVFSET